MGISKRTRIFHNIITIQVYKALESLNHDVLIHTNINRLTKAKASKITSKKKLPSIKPMYNQSGDINMFRFGPMPFWMTIRGVVGKNGPSSAHWAPSAITRMY